MINYSWTYMISHLYLHQFNVMVASLNSIKPKIVYKLEMSIYEYWVNDDTLFKFLKYIVDLLIGHFRFDMILNTN